VSDYEDYQENFDEQEKKFIQEESEENNKETSFPQDETDSQIEEIDEYLDSSDLRGIRRPNQTKTLPERDLIRRTASIFESAKDCKVDLSWEGKGSGNYIARLNPEDGKQKYVINLESPAIKGIPKYSAAGHEFGHIAFDSLIGQTCKEYFRRQIPPQTPEEHKDHAYEMYDMTSNIIEDERMESLMGDLYQGTGKRFDTYKKAIGKGYGKRYTKPDEFGRKTSEKFETNKASNPAQAILYERFGRSDLIPKKWQKICKECIEDVRMTGKEGTITVGDKFITGLLNPWLLDNGKIVPKQQGKGKGQGGVGNGIGKIQEGGDMAKDYNDQCDHRGLANPKQNIGKPQTVEEAKQKGQQEVDDLKGKIDENNRKARSKKNTMPPDCGTINYIDRYDASIKIEVNGRVASSLNRIFREIQSKSKYKLHDDGEQLDMGAVIRRKARGYGQVFQKKRVREDITILVSIDVSGSMGGQPVDEARKMSATIFKAIEGVKGIKFHTFAWNGGSHLLDITEINRINDVRAINCQGHGGTPTPEAMAYSVARLREMGGKKKVLIFITDGSPNNGTTGSKMVRKWVNIARAEKIQVIGVHSGGGIPQSTYDYGMSDMFGKDGFMVYEDMDKASATVIAKFKQLALKAVKRG